MRQVHRPRISDRTIETLALRRSHVQAVHADNSKTDLSEVSEVTTPSLISDPALSNQPSHRHTENQLYGCPLHWTRRMSCTGVQTTIVCVRAPQHELTHRRAEMDVWLSGLSRKQHSLPSLALC